MMERLGFTISNAHRAGWGNILDWFRHLPQTSASWRAANPEIAEYASPLRQSAIMMDLYDAIGWFNYTFACANSKSKPHKPKPYPRPGTTEKQTFGSDPIPVSQFDEWYYSQD